MIKLVITERADQDLEDIWLYVATTSYPEYADAVLDQLVVAFELLSSNPSMGAMREELGGGVRLYPLDKINIIYWLKGKKLEVLRVYHSARDFCGL